MQQWQPIDSYCYSFYFCCFSFFEDCHQSRYSSWCFLRGSSLDPFALSRSSSIFSDDAKSPQLLQIKFLLARSYFSSPPHSGQKLANRYYIWLRLIKGFQACFITVASKWKYPFMLCSLVVDWLNESKLIFIWLKLRHICQKLWRRLLNRQRYQIMQRILRYRQQRTNPFIIWAYCTLQLEPFLGRLYTSQRLTVKDLQVPYRYSECGKRVIM